jgi:hypothetical protein
MTPSPIIFPPLRYVAAENKGEPVVETGTTPTKCGSERRQGKHINYISWERDDVCVKVSGFKFNEVMK